MLTQSLAYYATNLLRRKRLVSAWAGLFCYIISALPGTAQTAPKYSNEFLAIGVGARAIGMGTAATAVSSDVTAGYWNPAGLVYAPTRFQGTLMHAQYFAGLANYDYAGFSTKLDTSSALSFSFVRFAVDNIPDTRFLIVADVIDYSRVRRFSSSDNAFLISYGKKVASVPGLSFGGSAKVIYRNGGVFATAWGFGIDLGAQYRKGNWLLGAHLRDATTTFNAWSFNTAEIADVFTRTGNVIPEASLELTLPRLVFGVAYQKRLGRFGGVASMDLETTTDGRRNTVATIGPISVDPRIGLEADYNNLVFLRAGLNQFQQIKSIDGKSKSTIFQPNFGVGLKLYKLTIDYALSNLGTTSESVYSHIFSLKFGFDKAR